MFRSKREGVHFVLDAVARAFPSSDVQVYAVDGRFLHPDRARDEPLAVAAANWAATARAVAARHPDAILLDTGTTTTDVIADRRRPGGRRPDGPIPIAWRRGSWSTPARLRTPTEAIASHIWVKGRQARRFGGNVRAGGRRARVAQGPGARRLHRADARRPRHRSAFCRRAPASRDLRRSRVGGRGRRLGDRRSAGARAGGAHRRSHHPRARVARRVCGRPSSPASARFSAPRPLAPWASMSSSSPTSSGPTPPNMPRRPRSRSCWPAARPLSTRSPPSRVPPAPRLWTSWSRSAAACWLTRRRWTR